MGKGGRFLASCPGGPGQAVGEEVVRGVSPGHQLGQAWQAEASGRRHIWKARAVVMCLSVCVPLVRGEVCMEMSREASGKKLGASRPIPFPGQERTIPGTPQVPEALGPPSSAPLSGAWRL